MKGDPSRSPGLLQAMGSHPSFSRVLVEGSPAGILVVDRDRRIQDMNPRMQAWIGMPRSEVIGRKCHEVLFLSEEPCPGTDHGCPALHALNTSEPSPEAVRTRIAENGRREELEIRAYPVPGKSGDIRYALEFVQDLTATVLLRSYREEAHLRDPLTGLYNRKAFHTLLARELSRTQRQGHPFSLALADFDSFKDYNEKQGNDAGDELLQRMGALLTATTRREVDAVFRLEGDLFAVTLPEAHREQAVRIGERIRLAEQEREIPVGFSLAICEAQDGEDSAALLHRTEEALFLAKKRGGTRIL